MNWKIKYLEYLVISIILRLLLPSSIMYSQHVSESNAAKDQPEHILAGIDIFKTKVQNVYQEFGEPQEIISYPYERYYSTGWETTYVWTRSPVKLQVTTICFADSVGNRFEPELYHVEVSGKEPSGTLGVTGQGLKLGDTLVRATTIYGSRFEKGRTEFGTLKMTFSWTNDIRLTIGFNTNKKIVRMSLTGSVE